MNISKYENFILESVINKLILEADVLYKKEFIDLLNDMKTGFHDPVEKICDFLLDISGRDLDLSQNYIGLSDEIDKITFIPQDKIEKTYAKVLPGTIVPVFQSGIHPIQRDANIPTEGLIHLQPEKYKENNITNKWKLIKTINMAIVPDTSYNQYTLYYLQNLEDPSKFTTAYKDNNSNINFPFEYNLPNNNNKIKIGRYVNKLLDLSLGSSPIKRSEYTSSDVEKFVNKFISFMEYQKNALDHFRIVSGEEIKYWYSDSNYSGKTGELGQSCMKYDYCQDYFNIYIENPDVCKLLIFTDINNKLLGRALLWKLKDGSNYMDRIYTKFDYYVELFKKWGKENGYTNYYVKNSDIILNVEVKPKDYVHYPYMDTFNFFKINVSQTLEPKGILTNKSTLIKIPYLQLQSTSGRGLEINYN